jgi:hypothetical protein
MTESESPDTPAPSDNAAWNRDRLDAARITGSTFERQNDVISPEAQERAIEESWLRAESPDVWPETKP